MKSTLNLTIGGNVKKFIPVFFVLLFFLIGISEASENIKIENIYEKEFDVDAPIEDIIFGKAKLKVSQAKKIGVLGLESKNSDEEVEIDYPGVLKTKNKVIWYKPDGTRIKELSLEKFGKPSHHDLSVYSNKTYLLKTGEVMVKNDSGLDVVDIYVYDDKGNFKWSKNSWIGYPKISGNEKYIATGKDQFGMFQLRECLFYNINGNLLWKYSIDAYDVIVKPLFSKGVLIIERDTKGKVKIKLIGVNGKEIWEREIDIQHVRYVKSNNKNNIIIYGGIMWDSDLKKLKSQNEIYILYCFDENGNLLWQNKVKNFSNSFHHLALTKKSNYLVGFTMWKKIWIMNIATGKIIWERPLKDFNITEDVSKHKRQYRLDISCDGKYLQLIGIIWKSGLKKLNIPLEGKENEIFLIDVKNGDILEKDSIFKGEFIGESNLLQKTGTKLQRYKIEKE